MVGEVRKSHCRELLVIGSFFFTIPVNTASDCQDFLPVASVLLSGLVIIDC